MIIAVVYIAAAAIAVASLGLGFYALAGIRERGRNHKAVRPHVGRAALSSIVGVAAAAALVLLFT